MAGQGPTEAGSGGGMAQWLPRYRRENRVVMGYNQPNTAHRHTVGTSVETLCCVVGWP